VVARLAIDEAEFWIAEDPDVAPGPDGGAVRMIVTVDDPDARFARALAAGATEVSPVGDEHGWRVGRLADPFGHHWEVGTPTG
jgi:PhnB protein